jgi:peptidase M1-like protein
MTDVIAPFLAAAVVVCPAPPPTAEPAPERPRYVLDVRVAPSLRTVSGAVTVEFRPNQPTDRLVFRLWANGPAERRSGSRIETGNVTSDGRGLRTQRPDPTTLVVRLGRTLETGSKVTVRVPWRLHIPFTRFDRNGSFDGGVRLGSFFPILAWDARRGWVTDPPAGILAESSTSPAADFDIRVRAPRGLRAVVPGARVGPERWHVRAVRDVPLAVGRFRVATTVAHAPNPVTVRVAVTSGSAAEPLALAKRALEQLARRYGPYRWGTYTIVVAPDLGDVGIEYPTLVFIGRSADTRLLLDHETAHQWFYSLVGNDQASDPWLDETLATWAQTRIGSPEPVAGRRIPAAARRHVGFPMTYWSRQDGWYFYGVYGEGAKALKSLGKPAAVDCALRAYVARRAYDIAQPGDLLDELNRLIPGAERRLAFWGIYR